MKKIVLALLMLFVVAGVVSAGVLVTDTDSISTNATNWDGTLTLDKFDTNLLIAPPGGVDGTLDLITITITSTVNGEFNYESLDNAPSVIIGTLAADVTISKDGTLILTAAPSASESRNATAFDGIIDLGGTSGGTIAGMTATASDTLITGDTTGYTAVGLDTFTLDVAALGTSTGSGPGNLMLGFATNADAIATITYDYTAPTPEPMTMALLSLGGLAVLRRRRS